MGTVAVISVFGAPARSATYTDVPLFMTEQGRLLDSSGNPVAGPVTLKFSLYNDPTMTGASPSASGPLLWTDTMTNVPLDAGFFSAILGSTAADPLTVSIFKDAATAGKSLYLGITVNTDPELSPRQPLNTVPYAFVADNVIGDITPNSVTVGGVQVIKSDGSWGGPSTGLMGPQGNPGAPGAQGPQGANGAPGGAGPQGAAGAPGPQGVTGAQGPQGVAGSPGPQGVTGAQGAQGAAGAGIIVTSSSGSTTYLTSTCSNYANGSISITVPAAGNILVNAQAFMLDSYTAATAKDYVVGIGSTATDCSFGATFGAYNYHSAPAATESAYTMLYPFRVFPVSAAGTYTYYLNGILYSGAASSVAFYFDGMSATFFH
jgi:hypothetical protein